MAESQPVPEEPTAAQAIQIAQAAMKAAEEAKTATEAQQPVEAAIAEEGEAQGIKLDDEQVEAIASATIAQLDARGAFGPGTESPETPPQPPTAPEGGVEVPAPAEQQPGPPAAPVEEAPAKRSLAERFQGH